MGRRVKALYECDLCGTELEQRGMLESIGHDEKLYQVELCAKCLDKVQTLIDRIKAHADVVSVYRVFTQTVVLPKADAPNKREIERSKMELYNIRMWGEQVGLLVPDSKGKIPKDVMEKYDKEHPGVWRKELVSTSP